MPKTPLTHITRCPAALNGGKCDSAVFYDWGLQILDNRPTPNIAGEKSRFHDYSATRNITICARCTTPYILDEGRLVDISAELGAEDVKMILARGQSTLPHVKIKDP